MTEFLQAFLMMSLQGAVLIAGLLTLRVVFRKRMAPGVLYALWLLPAALLLIPGSVASVFSFQNLYSNNSNQYKNNLNYLKLQQPLSFDVNTFST